MDLNNQTNKKISTSSPEIVENSNQAIAATTFAASKTLESFFVPSLAKNKKVPTEM
jgi:hypothetical protein